MENSGAELNIGPLRLESCGLGIMSGMCMAPWLGSEGCVETDMLPLSTYECWLGVKSGGRMVVVGYWGPRTGMSPMKVVP